MDKDTMTLAKREEDYDIENQLVQHITNHEAFKGGFRASM